MFLGRISSVIEYFPRQSIHTPALVFQIGGGAKFFAPFGVRRLRQRISIFDSKRCLGVLYQNGVPIPDFPQQTPPHSSPDSLSHF